MIRLPAEGVPERDPEWARGWAPEWVVAEAVVVAAAVVAVDRGRFKYPEVVVRLGSPLPEAGRARRATSIFSIRGPAAMVGRGDRL